jgi:hypothetical protein
VRAYQLLSDLFSELSKLPGDAAKRSSEQLSAAEYKQPNTAKRREIGGVQSGGHSGTDTV